MREKCAVFGIYAPQTDVARVSYYGLWALQHRGQEGTGIVTTDSRQFYSHLAPGLVAQVYNDEVLDRLKGHIAVGHNRYSTSGGSDGHLQPIVRSQNLLALAHNGNLPSVRPLQRFLAVSGISTAGANDTELMATALSYHLERGAKPEAALAEIFPLLTGAFSCVAMTKTALLGFRDPYGIRPLAIGKLGGGYILASETAALDTIGAEYLREVKPGELVVVDNTGIHFHQLAEPTPKLDIFEFVYFARPDSMLEGQRVNEVRRRLGKQLAQESKAQADVVIPIPDSAIPAALGYSQVSGTPFDHGLIKNRYIHRTFIAPIQELRERDVQMKLNPLTETFQGKDILVIDDSIVRGTTLTRIVRMLKKAGARKIHLGISSPPIKYPDFYGIDTPDQSNLIAAKLPVEKIRQKIGADSLTYLSFEGMLKAIEVPRQRLCTSCFTGEYPIDLKERAKDVALVKH